MAVEWSIRLLLVPTLLSLKYGRIMRYSKRKNGGKL